MNSQLFLFLFLVFNSSFLFAQYEDLKENKDITWIAEFEMERNFNLPETEEDDVVQICKLLLPPSNFDNAYSSDWINRWIFNNALDGHYEVYKNEELKESLSVEDLEKMTSYVDTTVSYPLGEYEEQIRVVYSSFDPHEVLYFKTKEIIYYNEKTNDFNTRLIALAPVVYFRGRTSTMFWIKMEEAFPTNFDIQSPDITWGALISNQRTFLDTNKMKVIKGDDDFDLTTRLYKQFANMEKDIGIVDYGNKDYLTKKEIASYYSSVDTVITFDPETYAEHIRIVKNFYDYKETYRYRLIQEWYYDERKNKLINHLKAISPIIEIHDEDGNLRYLGPMYNILYNN